MTLNCFFTGHAFTLSKMTRQGEFLICSKCGKQVKR